MFEKVNKFLAINSNLSRQSKTKAIFQEQSGLKRKVTLLRGNIKKNPNHYSKEQLIWRNPSYQQQIRRAYNSITVMSYEEIHRWLQLQQVTPKQYNRDGLGQSTESYRVLTVHTKDTLCAYRDIYVGFTAAFLCSGEKLLPKNQAETPYSVEGGKLYFERTKKNAFKQDWMGVF